MKKILIIDDDPVMLKILQSSFLAKKEVELLTAIDPDEGLRKVQEQLPNLVLLDVMLPQKSGIEVLRQIKENPKTKEVPVVIFSIIGREDVRKQALELGAHAYLIKGLTSLQEMAEKIDAILEHPKS